MGVQTEHRAREFARAVEPAQLPVERGTVTEQLLARLDPAEVRELDERLASEPARIWIPGLAEEPAICDVYNNALPFDRRRLLLNLGVHLRIPAVLEKTGLSPIEPPQEVHAMARGALAAGGGLYEADMVADALASSGFEVGGARAALDFGCSSGRVLRALAAAYPAVAWHGCDPNAGAIAWAGENLAPTSFAVSGDEPPLALEDGALDFAYAISVWSHFAPALGLRWLAEMRRLIRPGGRLVMTTHGLTTIALHAAVGLREAEHCEEILAALYAQGWWYRCEFGADGDWGVVNPDWGTAFLAPEWVLANVSGEWRVAVFAPGRNAANQDVWVLERP